MFNEYFSFIISVSTLPPILLDVVGGGGGAKNMIKNKIARFVTIKKENKYKVKDRY